MKYMCGLVCTALSACRPDSLSAFFADDEFVGHKPELTPAVVRTGQRVVTVAEAWLEEVGSWPNHRGARVSEPPNHHIASRVIVQERELILGVGTGRETKFTRTANKSGLRVHAEGSEIAPTVVGIVFSPTIRGQSRVWKLFARCKNESFF
jgi:hypothetical protein